MVMRYSRIATLSAAALFIGACSAPGTPPATSAPSAIVEPSATVSPEARYVNDEAGFSLVLPEGWSAAGPFPVTIEGGGSYDLYILGLEPSAEGGPGTSRVFVADSAELTLEQFVLLQCSTCPEHPVEQTTLGSTSARATRIGGGSVPFEVEWFFVENSGRLIGLSIIDPETMESLNAVLQSFRPE
jgi:hypothetical protein